MVVDRIDISSRREGKIFSYGLKAEYSLDGVGMFDIFGRWKGKPEVGLFILDHSGLDYYCEAICFIPVKIPYIERISRMPSGDRGLFPMRELISYI